MTPTEREVNDPTFKREEELLRLEYQMCHAGYVSRDQIAQDEFAKIFRTFSLLLTILLGMSVFIKVNPLLHYFFTAVIGIAGCISMGALVVDLQSTSSAKVALRKRSLEIEERLGDSSSVFVLWRRIDNRAKFKFESTVKGGTGNARDQEETEGDLFALASQALISIWIAIALAVGAFGQMLTLATRTS